MHIRTIFTTAAVAAALVIGSGTAASAAPAHVNPLRFCAATVTTSCVSVMDNDEGDLTIVNRYGDRTSFASSRSALRWLKRNATACHREDSPRCYFDAAHRGNGVGDSFVTIGGRSVFYLGNLD